MGLVELLIASSMQAQLYLWTVFGIFAISFGCFPEPPPVGDQLPSVASVNPNSITLGGFSSGASFATQFHVGYSSFVKGVGLWCGLPELVSLQTGDAAGGANGVSVQQLMQDTAALESSNAIDSTSNLASSKVYIVHGSEDTVVDPLFAVKIKEFYEGYNVNQMVAKTYYKNGEHGVYSNRRGTPCGQMNYPTFIENCEEDTVYEMFQHLLPNIVGPGNDGEFSSSLKPFSQVEFFDNFASSSMSETGYYYVPESCNGNGNSCHLHVFFHGCTMSTDNIGTEFLENAGFLEMAETNKIVLLFPQIKTNWWSNPHGCWNFLGYNNDLHNGQYARKDAAQMRGMFNMINHMTGGAL